MHAPRTRAQGRDLLGVLPSPIQSDIAEADKRRQNGGQFFHLYQTKEEVGQRVLAGIHEFGMEPDVIGARVNEAIEANKLYIFSHPDHKEELREIHDYIIDHYIDHPKDPGHDQRVAFEKFRRDAFAETRAKSLAAE